MPKDLPDACSSLTRSQLQNAYSPFPILQTANFAGRILQDSVKFIAVISTLQC
ncbi:hypothetical protein ALP91_01785 [Pseudomonas savastanoi pv. glycinea]|nr:hypothetical protein ALP91_01785 [Pseudomonas savastanoi pv. glycinea]